MLAALGLLTGHTIQNSCCTFEKSQECSLTDITLPNCLAYDKAFTPDNAYDKAFTPDNAYDKAFTPDPHSENRAYLHSTLPRYRKIKLLHHLYTRRLKKKINHQTHSSKVEKDLKHYGQKENENTNQLPAKKRRK